VPLVGGREQKTISRDVQIDNSLPWQSQHYRSILSAYRRAPFFEFYEEGLEKLFRSKTGFLVDWNLACLEWLREQTAAKWRYTLTANYQDSGDTPGIRDLRDWFFPRWISERVKGVLPYRQVFEERHGFVSNLSILDLLFCAGPAAANKTK
jgi:hypothetical protein